MIRADVIHIRRVVDDALTSDADTISRALGLLRERFPAVTEFDRVPDKLRNPFGSGFRTLLYVAETARGRLRGCAVVSHEPVIGFVLLDWLVSDPRDTGGTGGALFARVRDDAARLDCVGVFLECLPDLPDEVPDPAVLEENRRRLKFYERLGARPIVGTRYRDPVKEGDTGLPFLLFAPTHAAAGLDARKAREVVRAILERKYGWLCPPEYVERVVRSFQAPIQLRSPRYPVPAPVIRHDVEESERIALVVSEGHVQHHVRERGYVEAPARVDRIRAVLEPSGLFAVQPTRPHPLSEITAVHDKAYVRFLQRVCAQIPAGRRVYPYVFPVRNRARMPDDLPVRAGYYCIDTFTPLHRDLFSVVRGAVDTTLTAALAIRGSRRLAYALVRPPGHHAESTFYGGFCYLNHAAIAAQRFRRNGAARVAILDLDYHHGNGQQEIFYRRSDVLTVSIHGDPTFAYPYFTGFAEERGEGEGEGFNLNLPQPERLDGAGYLKALDRALARVEEHRPDVLVVCLGLDPAAGDPTGTWSLREEDFRANGRRVGHLRRPTLVVQEGGYGLRVVGRNALAFLSGLHETTYLA